MEILNKIAELAQIGYTVSFKQWFPGFVCMEMTYEHYYHSHYALVVPIKVPAEYILVLLDEMRFKIDKLVMERKNGN